MQTQIIRSVQTQKPAIPHSVVVAAREAQYVAALALIKLVADVWNDWTQYNQSSNKGTMAAFMFFGNLAPDFVTVVTQAKSLPGELASLTPDGVDALLQQLSASLNMPTDKAKGILAAVLDVARDTYAGVTDIIKLIAAAKS